MGPLFLYNHPSGGGLMVKVIAVGDIHGQMGVFARLDAV